MTFSVNWNRELIYKLELERLGVSGTPVQPPYDKPRDESGIKDHESIEEHVPLHFRRRIALKSSMAFLEGDFSLL